MAGVSDDQGTSICSHCDRAIPSSNIDLHFAHCSRKLEKCLACGDMIPKTLMAEHFENTHALVTCSLCSETMERSMLDVHMGENCPQRILACEFCEYPLPAIDLLEHQEVCGNRTDSCPMCFRYIRLREMHNHRSSCTGIHDIVEFATDSPSESSEEGSQSFPSKRLVITIAITGIAVLVGSFLYNRKQVATQLN